MNLIVQITISSMDFLLFLIEKNTNTLYHTSDVDFCEKNDSTFIVEKFNTLSSLVIAFYGIYGLCVLYKNDNKYSIEYLYSRTLFYNLIIIGLCSAYFHSTISALGHLLDIYSIACTLSTAINIVDTNNSYSRSKNHNLKFILMLIINGLICLLFRLIEVFVLFFQGIYLSRLTDSIIIHAKITSKRDYFKTKLLFIAAIVFWLIDFLLCDHLNGIHLHFIFHIMIGKVAYDAIKILIPLMSDRNT